MIKVKYKHKKCSLDDILIDKNDDFYFNKYIKNSHLVADHVSHFIRLYIIYLFDSNKQLPNVDADFFKLCCSVIMKKGQGKTIDKDKIKDLTDFYDKVYSTLGYLEKDKISSLHLSQILGYIATEYNTAVENNIKLNFINYVYRYVNAFYINKAQFIVSDKALIEGLEFDYLRKLYPIIENLINKINFLMRLNFPHNKDKILTEDKKKLLNILLKFKHKYVSKYNKICKKLKIMPKLKNIDENKIFTLNDIYFDISLIEKLNSKYTKEIKEKNLESTQKRKIRDDKLKLLKAELFKVKKDIIDETNNADPKYNDFILNFRNNILPNYDKNNYTLLNYLKDNPQAFIKTLIIMVKKLEEKNYKLFQFLPLYSSFIQRYIKFDTKTLIEIFKEDNKNEYLGNIKKYEDVIWKETFKIDSKIFRMGKTSGFAFDYTIITNGITASIGFISDNQNKIKNKKIDSAKKAKKANKNLLNQFDNDKDKEKYKVKKEEKKLKEKLNKKIEANNKAKEERAKFKKLSKEQQEKIKNERKRKNQDFLYIDDLNDDELKTINKKLRKNKIVTLDPGKKNLIYMRNNNNVKFRYSNREHLTKTKRLVYAKRLEKLKDNLKIKDKENKLSVLSSKTVNIDNFKKYIKERNNMMNEMFNLYSNIKFRKLKWFSYINTKRAEDNLINKIKKTFGEDIVVFYGDWSIGKQMANFISTPNLSLKRKIAEHFSVYNLDEYNTSKLSNVTFNEVENLVAKDKFGNFRELHSVLTYQKEITDTESKSKRSVKCHINRDNNSSRNMMYIINFYLKHKRFPKEFTRTNNKEKNEEIIENIHKALFLIKDIDIKKENIKDILKKINNEKLEGIAYILKNSVCLKKNLVPENKKSAEEKNIVGIINEIKKGKEVKIKGYDKKDELIELFKKQYNEKFSGLKEAEPLKA